MLLRCDVPRLLCALPVVWVDARSLCVSCLLCGDAVQCADFVVCCLVVSVCVMRCVWFALMCFQFRRVGTACVLTVVL